MTEEKHTNHQVGRGEVIMFSCGHYSDYSYCGEVIFTRDCDLAEQLKTYKKDHPDAAGPIYHNFITWLVAEGFCLPLECREISIGTYGDLEL